MPTLADALNFVKSLDLNKVKKGVDIAQTGVEMASAAFEKPEVVLAGLLKTFSKRAMQKDLAAEDAKDIARMAMKAIRGAKKAEDSK